MKNLTDTNPLQITVNPATVYISTNQDQFSYANIEATIENGNTGPLNVTSVAITLPAALAPVNTLNSITPIAEQVSLWSFAPSPVNPGEFDASPQSGDYVTINASDKWVFALNLVTLISTITQSSADISITVNFDDGPSYTVSLNVNFDPAVASIISFNSAPANINPGQTSTLNWQCEEIDYCVISPIDGLHRKSSDSFVVSPGDNTIYTLFAYGTGVILSAQWAISVDNPQIIKFGGAAGQTSIDCGGNITLVWECNQFTQNIAMVNNAGVVIPDLLTGINTIESGSITVGPINVPTTFTFTAYGNTTQNFDQRNPTININDAVYSLAPNPDNGSWTGDNVTLTWNVESVSAVSLSPAVANGPSLDKLSGSVVVNPTADTTYILSVFGFESNEPQNNLQTAVSLSVQPVIINSFTISPEQITPDEGLNQGTLAWGAQAQVVSIDNGIGSQPVTGNYLLNTPADGTVYNLTAGTNLKPALQTATLTIANAYGPYTFNNFTNDATIIVGVDLMVPNPGSMQFLKQGFNGGYSATITGLTTVGTPPAGYAVLAMNQQQSYFIIMAWPLSTTQVAFEWADPNNQTGTITLAPLANPADDLKETLKNFITGDLI